MIVQFDAVLFFATLNFGFEPHSSVAQLYRRIKARSLPTEEFRSICITALDPIVVLLLWRGILAFCQMWSNSCIRRRSQPLLGLQGLVEMRISSIAAAGINR